MARGKGKRARHQSRGDSGISPPVKRTARRRKNTLQTSISEWIIDEDQHALKQTTPPPSQLPLAHPSPLLSPIMSQPSASPRDNTTEAIKRGTIFDSPRGNTEGVHREGSTAASPISDVLNLAASATSLRQDFAMCEKIMSEKHNFLVAMLDGMDRKVSSFGDKIVALEARIKTLEENENHQMNTARGIYQAANVRHNDLEAKIKECAAAIGENNRKCDIIEKLSERIVLLESARTDTSHPQNRNTPQQWCAEFITGNIRSETEGK